MEVQPMRMHMIKMHIALTLALLAIVIAGCTASQAPAQPSPAPVPSAPEPSSQPEAPAVPEEQTAAPSEYVATKDEGIIRGVGCDLASKTVTFELTNPTETDWVFYQKILSPPANSLQIKLNGKLLLDLDCDKDSLAAGETVRCSKTGNPVFFREATGILGDRISTQGPQIGDELMFRCAQ